MNKKMLMLVVSILIIALVVIIGVVVMTKDKSNNKVEGSLEDIMKKLYQNLPEESLPELANLEITADNIEYFLGTSDIDYSEALASEPLMSSFAHSVVLVRLNNEKDVKDVKEKIINNVNPAKWICVEVDRQNVKVASRGNLVVLIMDNEVANNILDNFKNL